MFEARNLSGYALADPIDLLCDAGQSRRASFVCDAGQSRRRYEAGSGGLNLDRLREELAARRS
jgi:hypothetical protein